MSDSPKEQWGVGYQYERYVGRWSRFVAPEFLAWLAAPEEGSWLDVGCGTGSLVEFILANYAPTRVIGIDRAEGFLADARRTVSDPRAKFELGNATDLPMPANLCDVVVSGLVLNFVSDHKAMAQEMMRVAKPAGTVAAYVWDYAGGMEMMRHFWDAAIAVSPQDAHLDQAERFPLCNPDPLRALFQEVGLTDISVRAIDVATVFRDFDDYWTPFLGKQGAAPTYLASVDEATRERIRQLLHARLTPQDDGTIALSARAWAIKGIA